MSGEDRRSVDQEKVEDTMPPAYDENKGLTDGEEATAVKITSSETKIEMGKEKEKEEGFKGLSKEELMQYANDPYWVRLRWTLFILFWVIWLAMLVASVVIIIYAPKCPSPDPKQWWQKGPVYKVDITNFPDTNSDNKGDLAGVEGELDYLVKAGVGTAYFTNLLSSLNLKEVDSEFGTMEDWASLSRGLQERGIRVMVDFSPGSTSVHHIWYEEAMDGKIPQKNYYKTGTSELDLNNPAVVAELVEVLNFWMKNGVDGFVVDGTGPGGTVPKNVLDSFRAVLEVEEEQSGVPKVLVAKDDWTLAGGDYVGVGAGDPLHLALSEDLLQEEGKDVTADSLEQKLDTFMASLPCSEDQNCVWPAFSMSTTSHGEDLVDALTMFKMLLPGSIVTQSGEELGLPKFDMAKVDDTVEKKHLALYSLLADKLRHQEAILFGQLTDDNTFVKNGTVFGLTRVKKGSPGYVLLINFGTEEATVDVSAVTHIPDSIRVMEGGGEMAVSPQVDEVEVKRFDSNAVPLLARQAKIFNFVPKFD